MRQVELIPQVEHLDQMNKLYGLFDLDINTGRPTEQWEWRNLKSLRLPFPLQSAYFPGFWLKRVQVNRRAAESLSKVLAQMADVWTPEALEAHGLDRFVRCYSFGTKTPDLFWHAGGWELSPMVGGEPLSEAIRIFQRFGWTYCGHADKKRIREFEFW